MVYSKPTNHHKPYSHAAKPHVVNDEIDLGAIRLQPPKIRPVSSRKTESRRHAAATQEIRPDLRAVTTDQLAGAITHWETPYNRPAFETPENIQYTRLASQYLQQGRIEDAERLYKQALIVAERTFPQGDPAIFRAIEDLAGFYYRHEKYQQAEPLVSRLLKQRVERLTSDDWMLIRTVDQLADIYEKCGQPVQAQSLYKLLLARQEETIGRNTPVCAFTLSRLADSYLKQHHYSAAETLMLTILEIQETLHGRSSIEISTTLQELSRIYQKLGRYDKAAEMLERLLHVLESIHGDNGLSVASCLLKLADLLTEVDMVLEAEPLYRRAQEIYTLSYGDRTAAHSVFKKKIERVTGTMSKLSKDKPVDQEECSRFPAVRMNLDDMLPSKLGTGQVNRCLGHAVSENVVAAVEPVEERIEEPFEQQPVEEQPVMSFEPSSELASILDPLFASELSKIYDTGSTVELSAESMIEISQVIPLFNEKTAELPKFEERLPERVPGLVTVTNTAVRFESSSNVTPMQLRDTVKERAIQANELSKPNGMKDRQKPLLLPEPFPSSRRKSTIQSLFPVAPPSRTNQ